MTIHHSVALKSQVELCKLPKKSDFLITRGREYAERSALTQIASLGIAAQASPLFTYLQPKISFTR